MGPTGLIQASHGCLALKSQVCGKGSPRDLRVSQPPKEGGAGPLDARGVPRFWSRAFTCHLGGGPPDFVLSGLLLGRVAGRGVPRVPWGGLRGAAGGRRGDAREDIAVAGELGRPEGAGRGPERPWGGPPSVHPPLISRCLMMFFHRICSKKTPQSKKAIKKQRKTNKNQL